MIMSDGVRPSNVGRGYVLRRLLRRTVQAMRVLGVTDPVIPELLPVSKEAMVASYPELNDTFHDVSEAAYGEEDAFRRTLETGTDDSRRGRQQGQERFRRARRGRRGRLQAARHLRLPD